MRSMKALLVSLGLLIVIGATADAALPQTPAAQVLTAWIAAVNSGDDAQMDKFDAEYSPGPVPTKEFAPNSGLAALNVVRVEQSEPLTIQVIAEAANSGRQFQIKVVVTDETPPQVWSFRVLGVEIPEGS